MAAPGSRGPLIVAEPFGDFLSTTWVLCSRCRVEISKHDRASLVSLFSLVPLFILVTLLPHHLFPHFFLRKSGGAQREEIS